MLRMRKRQVVAPVGEERRRQLKTDLGLRLIVRNQIEGRGRVLGQGGVDRLLMIRIERARRRKLDPQVVVGIERGAGRKCLYARVVQVKFDD